MRKVGGVQWLRGGRPPGGLGCAAQVIPRLLALTITAALALGVAGCGMAPSGSTDTSSVCREGPLQPASATVVSDACRELPIPSAADAYELAMADALLEWVQSWFTYADASRRVGPIEVMPLDDAYSSLRSGRLAAICGGVSNILARVYGAFGFTAYAYDMGDPDTLTHVVTIVRADGKLHIQDGSYGYVLRDRKGQRLDFPSAMLYLRDSPWLTPVAADFRRWPKKVLYPSSKRSAADDGCTPGPRPKTIVCREPSYGWERAQSDTQTRAYQEFQRREGLRTSPLFWSMLTKPIWVHNPAPSPDQEPGLGEFQALVAQLAR